MPATSSRQRATVVHVREQLLLEWHHSFHVGAVGYSELHLRGEPDVRIVSWNCCQAFRRKWEYVDAFEPDILVVPEAECIAKQPAELLQRYPHHAWVGDNDNKGLLILAASPYPLAIHDAYNNEHRYVLPLNVHGAPEFSLLAVWTQRDNGISYTQHLSRALEEYQHLLERDVVIVGDFNANAIWDHEHRRDVTHSENVAWLQERGILSAYHHLTGEAQGEETAQTHAFRRDADNTFHIDYCFASKALVGPSSSAAVRPVAEWIGLSDHGPLVADLCPVEG